jgi:hypothetical protein
MRFSGDSRQLHRFQKPLIRSYFQVARGRFLITLKTATGITGLIGAQGLTVGAPLDAFQGVLRGVPHYCGESKPLMREENA